jgi:hypothetical protein
MDNWYRTKGKREEHQDEPAPVSGPRPGDFPPGSLESRAAARAIILERRKRPVNVMRLIMHIPRPPWAPPYQKCEGEEMQIVFTDDPTSDQED